MITDYSKYLGLDSEKIIDEIAGNVNVPYMKFPSRENAIKYAVEISEAGDIVLLAGNSRKLSAYKRQKNPVQ